MSEWVNGRTASNMEMFCPGCGRRLGIPEGFDLPELLKCQSKNCGAQWVLIRGSTNWAAIKAMKEKHAEVQEKKT